MLSIICWRGPRDTGIGGMVGRTSQARTVAEPKSAGGSACAELSALHSATMANKRMYFSVRSSVPGGKLRVEIQMGWNVQSRKQSSAFSAPS